MNKRLPAKLEVEPVVNAVFELRVATDRPLHESVPSMMYSKFTGQIEGLQALPVGLVLQDSSGQDASQYMVKLRIDWRGFQFHLGDRAAVVTYEGSYPGGDAFKAAIYDFVDAILDAGLVTAIERYSLKYINFFPGASEFEFVNDMDWNLTLGGASIGDKNVMLRFEAEDGDFRTITSVLTKAQLQQRATQPRTGGVIEVDEICLHSTSDTARFRSELHDRLDELRTRNKQAFFNALTDAAIERLGPTYDAADPKLH